MTIARKLVPFFLLAVAQGAHAQSVAITDLSASTTACGAGVACGSVGTTAQLVVPAASAGFPRQQLTIANSAAAGGNTVSCGYGAGIALNGIGTFTVPPQGAAFWPRGTAPANAIWCIASGSNTPLQIALGN